MTGALNVLLRTSDYRGDHAADVAIAHEVKDDESVLELADRLLADGADGDWIEIRRVRAAGDTTT